MGSVFKHIHFSEFAKCGKIKTKCGQMWNVEQHVDKMWKIHGTYPGNIYGIYKECIRNIHRYLWYEIIRNADPMGCRRRRDLCFWLFDIINVYGYSLYIPYIFHIYFPNMFVLDIFPLVCFLLRTLQPVLGQRGCSRNRRFKIPCKNPSR